MAFEMPKFKTVWLTTSEAGVAVVYDYDPAERSRWGAKGWGYAGPLKIPVTVIERYYKADKEFWAATRELTSYRNLDDD